MVLLMMDLLVLHQIVEYALGLFIPTLMSWVWNRASRGHVDILRDIFVLRLAEVTHEALGLPGYLVICAGQFPIYIVHACQIVILLRFFHFFN